MEKPTHAVDKSKTRWHRQGYRDMIYLQVVMISVTSQRVMSECGKPLDTDTNSTTITTRVDGVLRMRDAFPEYLGASSQTLCELHVFPEGCTGQTLRKSVSHLHVIAFGQENETAERRGVARGVMWCSESHNCML